MDYKGVLSSDLGISAEEFAATWNAEPESREAAQIRLETLPGVSFDPLTNAAIAVLTGIFGNTISTSSRPECWRYGRRSILPLPLHTNPSRSSNRIGPTAAISWW